MCWYMQKDYERCTQFCIHVYNVINVYVSCVPSSEYMFFSLVGCFAFCLRFFKDWVVPCRGQGLGGGEDWGGKRAAPVQHQPIHTTIQRLLGTNREMYLYDSHPRQGTGRSVQLPSHISVEKDRALGPCCAKHEDKCKAGGHLASFIPAISKGEVQC